MTTPSTDQVSVLPCPWCNESPDVSNDAIFQLTDGCKWGALTCCGTGPEVRTDYKDVGHWKASAIEAWNERAAIQPASDAVRAEQWRTLALQYDGHRMQALWHLRAMMQDAAAHAPIAEAFLAAPPSSTAPAQLDGDAERAGDWPEDFAGENGQYQNQCRSCSKVFIGNKHRRVCKSCAATAQGELSALPELSDAEIDALANKIGMGTTRYENDPSYYWRRFARELLLCRQQGGSDAWQPIETAPMDGTHILVCRNIDADGKPMGDTFGLFVQRAAWWKGDNGWIVYCSLFREPHVFFEPTHWMPIPAPPAIQAQAGDAKGGHE